MSSKQMGQLNVEPLVAMSLDTMVQRWFCKSRGGGNVARFSVRKVMVLIKLSMTLKLIQLKLPIQHIQEKDLLLVLL